MKKQNPKFTVTAKTGDARGDVALVVTVNAVMRELLIARFEALPDRSNVETAFLGELREPGSTPPPRAARAPKPRGVV